MQSMLNLRGSYGLPLSVSGITHPLNLSKEIADHDRRREAVKKQRREATDQFLRTDHEMGIHDGNYLIMREVSEGDAEVVDEEDPARVLQDLANICLACTAKAA